MVITLGNRLRKSRGEEFESAERRLGEGFLEVMAGAAVSTDQHFRVGPGRWMSGPAASSAAGEGTDEDFGSDEAGDGPAAAARRP